jgi:nucleotidyltransferase/DNA polymerase involved in DNA repair
MDYVWELIAPWVAALGGAGGVGLITYTIVRALVGKVIRKNNTMLDATFNIDSLAQRVAERLGGKTLNIDVTAVTEKALKKLAKQLDEKIQKVEDATNSYKRILALIGKGIAKLKALTKDEVSELASAITAIESEYTPPEENQPMTVVFQPIAVSEEKEEAVPAGVNFSGLGDE